MIPPKIKPTVSICSRFLKSRFSLYGLTKSVFRVNAQVALHPFFEVFSDVSINKEKCAYRTACHFVKAKMNGAPHAALTRSLAPSVAVHILCSTSLGVFLYDLDTLFNIFFDSL